MALVIADRVKETSTTTGTGALTLAGAMTGFQTFAAKCAVGDTCLYGLQGVDASGALTGAWECGIGTYSGANTLTRTTVMSSSNAGAAVALSAGTKQVYITMPAVQVAWIRERLSADRTYYVRTDGNNSNAGLVNTAGGAFLTIQAAVDLICNTLSLGGFSVTVQVADGTYTTPTVLKPLFDSGIVIIKGNVTTPANVLISTTSASCFAADGAKVNYTIKDMKVQTTTSGYGIYAQRSAVIYFGNLDFGACASHHMRSDNGAYIESLAGSYTISGGAGAHLVANFNGYIRLINNTINLTGTPVFTQAFVAPNNLGVLYTSALTFTGTGASAGTVRYAVTANGLFMQNGLTMPGGAAGTTASGGQVV